MVMVLGTTGTAKSKLAIDLTSHIPGVKIINVLLTIEDEVKLRLSNVTIHEFLSDVLTPHHVCTHLQENLFFDTPVVTLISCFTTLCLYFYNSNARCVLSLKSHATMSNDVICFEEDKEDIDLTLDRTCVAKPWHLPAVTTSRIVSRVKKELRVSDGEGLLVCLRGF